MELPSEYIIQKFYQFAGYPKYKRITNVYEAGCPICREGSSWGKKRRLYYVVKDNAICCHNCGWYGNPIKWIQEVSDLTFNDIVNEVRQLDYGIKEDITGEDRGSIVIDIPDLPKDSINLFDTSQLRYYKSNQIVKKCLDVIASRRLDTADNRPSALYVSLNDKVHRNRLIIPFYTDKKCTYYQTRGILPGDLQKRPKYLSKIGGDRSLFNYDNVSSNCDTIYILEGPIDSFFLRDSVAVAGIQENSQSSLTKRQRDLLSKHFLAKNVWVLDSQWQDQASLTKSKVLAEQGANIFVWPRSLGTKYKDLNDICIGRGIDSVPRKLIDEYTYSGLRAKLALSDIK